METLKSTARELLRRLDHAGLQQYSQAEASNLEATTPLLNSSLRQVTALSGKLAGDWRHSRWELLSQDAHFISSYLPNVANVRFTHFLLKESVWHPSLLFPLTLQVCISACGMLKRSSDQAALQSYLRTVLETTDALSTRLLTQMDNRVCSVIVNVFTGFSLVDRRIPTPPQCLPVLINSVWHAVSY